VAPKLSGMDNLQPSQLAQYIPILFLLAAAVGFAGGTLLISVLLGKFAKSSKAKDTAYECGKDPIGEGAGRFSVKFYLVAMLFILFDIEVVFMYPWAVVYRDMLMEHATRNLILGSMISFLVILFAGYIYALKTKAFDWKS
jgi:NADH-quinone oxidoreductase subunit A